MNLNKNLLCLKWDEFDRFVVSGLSNLFQKDDMADTTLFCDGRSFKAHKLVLSIWSSYFREIFTATSHAHPVIVLRETTSSDLELILRFIYQGQLFVPFEDTERFLKTAEYFQIAGLRDMRIHLSSGEPRFPGSSTTLPNTSTNGSPLHNNIGGIAPMTQHFVSPTTSYALHNVNTSTVDGIPIQILNSSTTPPQGEHSNTINPISIVTSNSTAQQQFSTNVIKPIPSRQSSRLNQQLHSPPISTSYTHAVTNPAGRSQGQEFVYSTQPILIVHNQQKPNEYHHEINKTMVDSRSSEPLLVMERIGNANAIALENKRISSAAESLSAGGADETMLNNSYNNHENHVHQPEEVLGLAYMHENQHSRSSTNSHIIQEAAVAAGVASNDTEIIEINRDSAYASTDSTMNSSAKSTKMNTNNVVLTTSTSAPVYAVKRAPVPQTNSSTTSEACKASSSSSKSKSFTSTNPNFKSKNKRRRRISSQNPNIELVSCPKCDKMVKKTSLKVHITRTHLEEGTVLICPICSKQISSKGVYYKHMYGHRQKDTKYKQEVEETNSTRKPKESRT